MSPYSPGFSAWSRPWATAVVTNRRSPQTTGAEWPSPASGVFHFTFFPVSTSHSTGAPAPFATPEAAGPRNWGQSPAVGVVSPGATPVQAGNEQARISSVTRNLESGRECIGASSTEDGSIGQPSCGHLTRPPAFRPTSAAGVIE